MKTAAGEKVNAFGKGLTRFLLRVCYVLLIVVYLALSLSWGWSYVRYYWYARFSPQQISQIVSELVQEGSMERGLDVLKLYPRERSADLLKEIESVAPEFSPLFYFELSRRAIMANDQDAALFWALLGQMRISFDGRRCPSEKTLEFVKFLRQVQTPPPVAELLANDPNAFDEGVRKVLDWDKEHPPQSRPDYLCDMIAKAFPKEEILIWPETEWPALWRNFRETTEKHLEERAKAK